MTTNRITKSESKLIPGIDVLKFVMALVIVNIHVRLYLICGQPLLCTAWLYCNEIGVPTFFILSSYFLFKKIRNANKCERGGVLLRYEKRLLKLYCFWIIALSPVILICWHKEYLDLSFYSLYLFIRNFFLAYEFGASWFFGALIVGVPIVYLLTRVFKDWLVWIIPMAIYVYLFMECDNKTLYLWYEENIRTPILSFPAGLIWITIGYLFSNEKFEQLRINTPVWICALLLMASIVLGTIFEEYDYLFRIVSVVSVVIPAFNLKMAIPKFVNVYAYIAFISFAFIIVSWLA